MKKSSIITLIDAINREGLSNDSWAIVEDVPTRSYFGTIESKLLLGSWLVIYSSNDEIFSFIDACEVEPTYRFHTVDGDILLLYKLY